MAFGRCRVAFVSSKRFGGAALPDALNGDVDSFAVRKAQTVNCELKLSDSPCPPWVVRCCRSNPQTAASHVISCDLV